MISFNRWGLVLIVAGGLLGGFCSLALHMRDAAVMVLCGLLVAAADLGLRLSARYWPRWLINERAGASLSVVPFWVVGLLIAGVNYLILQ